MGIRPSQHVGAVAVAPVITSDPVRIFWSTQQTQVFDWFQTKYPQGKGPVHLIVRARAGTGKTTTIIEGVNRAPEDSILLCAFNKRIAVELASRVTNPNVQVKTLHALGLRLIRREWAGMPVTEKGLRGQWLTAQAVRQTEKDNGEKTPYRILSLITQLHTKGREMVPLTYSPQLLTALALRFDLVPDEGWGKYDQAFVVMAAHRAMQMAQEIPPDSGIGVDWADMLFLPLVWNLTAPDYQLGVVDEAQDMTVAQLELFQRCVSGRICVVGDDRQAIYGFRGADSGSLDRLKKELQALELPLTETYRCAGTIVAKAQMLVPDLVGLRQEEGIVDKGDFGPMLDLCQPGDFVLSRLNAPLVSVTLRLLRQGTRARMAGRDLGQGILKILKKLKITEAMSLSRCVDTVQAWERQTVTKLAASGVHDLIARTKDQAGMILSFCEDVDSVQEMLQKMEYLFVDLDDAGPTPFVACSSVHKAKGLEARRVFVLADTLRTDSQEELNIQYVAMTRAKDHLTMVWGLPGR